MVEAPNVLAKCSTLFHFDGCLRLTASRLALDARQRQQWGYISHAHADHMARHEWTYATPATLRLCRHRLGRLGRFCPLPLRQQVTFGSVRLTTYPAGHCLGSSMLLVDDGSTRLLHTGDFKLRPALTAEAAEIPTADILVMESTFGKPRYCLPPRDEIVGQLIATVRDALSRGQTPVIHAYQLGKSQEVTAILLAAGIGVQQHPSIYEVSEVYRELGVPLVGSGSTTLSRYRQRPLPGHAVVTLPKSMGRFRLGGLGDVFSIAVTGWAVDSATRYRWDVDLALPLSDHADFNELLELVERVSPREVVCMHGPAEFADHLRDRGISARPLVPPLQRQLF